MIMRAIESLASQCHMTIDWGGYERRYMDFVEEQRQAEAAAKAPPTESPEPEDAVVFGGG
jgi:hypothetical protein